MIMHKVTTLNQFIIERQAEIPGATRKHSLTKVRSIPRKVLQHP